MGPARDKADRPAGRPDLRSVTRDVARVGLEADQGPARALRFDVLQRLPADELTLGQLHRPAKTCLVWVRLLIHVVAVKAQRRLEPGRVACAQAGRQHALTLPTSENRVPRFADAVRADEQLEAVLARVSRARD